VTRFCPGDFLQALRAFDLFTADEKRAALKEFAALKYPSIEDRFFEAVYRIIERHARETMDARP
jgi:hypothetical protein